MNRNTGEYVRGALHGEPYQAFVPSSLPPDPPLEFDATLLARTGEANRALGRLDGAAELLPDTQLFLYTYVRKEAVLSSQIEGTQSSLADLLLFEHEAQPGVPVDDTREVSNYVAAMDHGLARLREGFPLSLRLLREIHGILMSGTRGAARRPGEFRQSQNWLGGQSPAQARFVPPPPERLAPCLDAFERFLHEEELPVLTKAALAHVQFETLHPFLDGNGRLGRLLITLLLVDAGVLREPLLYLSLYFKTHRAEYYDRLNAVRIDGDWESWLNFFLEGITQTATQAVETARRLLALFAVDRERVGDLGRIAGSCLKVHELLQRRPVLGIKEAVRELGINRTTISRCFGELERLGVCRELTGRERNRLYAYAAYLDVLNEGTEPLSS